jgi:hypothetical protein
VVRLPAHDTRLALGTISHRDPLGSKRGVSPTVADGNGTARSASGDNEMALESELDGAALGARGS